ncbi:MAG: TolC family protein [Magnetococcales bacterium]|nr:TolC family protein [Magnetococcales bacterium]
MPRLLLIAGLFLVGASFAQAEEVVNLPMRQVAGDEDAYAISLKEFVDMVANSDELIRAQGLEERIAKQGVRGAEAVYEPFLNVTIEREGSHVLNSASEAVQRGVRPNDLYDSLESRGKVVLALKAPTGASAELNYNLTQTVNSTQTLANTASPEFKGYFGFNISQPLLRGAGVRATHSGITIAKIELDVARQTIRQVMAQRVMEGLNSYIAVQRAMERVRLRRQALEVATRIDAEVTMLFSEGLQPESEVTKARSSLALRRAQLSEAQEDLEEQLKSLQAFVAVQERITDLPLTASRLIPATRLATPDDTKSKDVMGRHDPILDDILDRRPEAKVNALRIDLEDHKAWTARDQTLPELALTVRAGRDNLTSQNKPFQYLEYDPTYHSWMFGAVFKMGIFGDEKKKGEFEAAKLRGEQARLTLEALRQRIANEVNSSGFLLDKAVQRLARQKEIVKAQKDLLGVTRKMHEEGNKSGLDVMKQELEVLLAEEAESESLAHANRASYLYSQVEGTLLERLQLE